MAEAIALDLDAQCPIIKSFFLGSLILSATAARLKPAAITMGMDKRRLPSRSSDEWDRYAQHWQPGKTGIEARPALPLWGICSPSRSSLMSARLPIHVNDLNIEPDCYNPKDPVSGFSGIPRNMTGIATKLNLEAGYVTHQLQVGKWDAGMATIDAHSWDVCLTLHLDLHPWNESSHEM